MPTLHEQFWDKQTFAFVGHTARKGFPHLSYREAKRLGKKVFAVDPSLGDIQGDLAYPDFDKLPEKVDAAILEVPREDMLQWVERAAEAGIGAVWMHHNRETPEAIALAREKGLEVLTGACAVMYLNRRRFSVHSIHRWVVKRRGAY